MQTSVAETSNAETCLRCGHISSNDLCKACVLLEGLEEGLAASSDMRNRGASAGRQTPAAVAIVAE